MRCAIEKVNGGVFESKVMQVNLISVVVVVEAHVGRFWAESAGRYRGAKCIFTLIVPSY